MLEDATGIGDDGPQALPRHERVYRALRGRILEGALEPGRPLTLRGLAEALSVSMTPAREAVRRLVAERALALTETGRVLVPDPDARALAELFAARALLEPERARRALPGIDAARAACLAEIDERIGRAVAAGDAGGYVAANTRFHATLYEAAEAPALMALVESVWLQTAPALRRVYERAGGGGQDFHEAALAAIAARDADALAAAIRADVEQGAQMLALR